MGLTNGMLARSLAGKLLASFLLALLSSVLGACGSGGSATHLQAAKAGSSATLARRGSYPVPPSPAVVGDYDGDDELGGRRDNDADRDDNAHPSDRDQDYDGGRRSYFDRDDDVVRRFGHAASAADRTAIAALVRRYFQAALAGDGTRGCAMMRRSLANSMSDAFVGPSGPPYAHGKTCAEVTATIFTHFRRQLSVHVPRLVVADVRIDGSEGRVTLAFKGLPGRHMEVAREAGAWKIAAVLDIELP